MSLFNITLPNKDLRSISKASILHLISEGVIAGPAHSFYSGDKNDILKSIFFDDTPVRNTSGSYNYNGVSVGYRDGSQTADDYLTGWTTAESDKTGGSGDEIEQGVWITKTTTENDVDAVRLTLKSNAFFRSSKKGNMYGTIAELRIQTSPNGSTWTDVLPNTGNDGVIRGKSISGYEYSIRIEKPEDHDGIWYFRITRTDEVFDKSRHKNAMLFHKYTELKDVKEAYVDSAILGLHYDAEATGGASPKTDGIWAGILCKVPDTFIDTVFNDDGSVYRWGYYLKSAGVQAEGPNDMNEAFDYWLSQGAQYKTVWTQDPAWILRETLLNDRFGLGTFVNKDDVDEASFFEYSYYNCELVDDGYDDGGVNPDDKEPRFTFNGPIQKRESAKKVLQSICSMSRAYLFSAGNTIRVIQDRPTTPVAVLTNANVINGEFTYSGPELQDHTTSMNVTFNNKNDRFLPSTVTVSDFIKDGGVWRKWQEADGDYSSYETAIDAFKLNTKSFAAFGVTSEGQAIRQAVWAMDTNLNSNNKITFKIGWNNTFIEPGDVIEISDSMFTGDRHGGYVSDGALNFIDLDIPVTLQAGVYTLKMYDADGNQVSDGAISETNGTFSRLTLATGSFASTPKKGQTWIVEGPSSYSGGTRINARQARITSISEDKVLGQMSVTAVEFDPTKFARVEDGISIPRPSFSAINNDTIDQVENLSYDITSTTDASGKIVSTNINLEWDDIRTITEDVNGSQVSTVNPNFGGYIIKWRYNNDNWESSGIMHTPNFVIANADVGEYTIAVYARNLRGVLSPGAYASIDTTLDASPGASELDPIDSATLVSEDLDSDEYKGQNLLIKWTDPNLDDLTGKSGSPEYGTVLDYLIEIVDEADTVMRSEYVSAERFSYMYNMNESDWGTAQREIKVKVYVRDTRLELTEPAIKVFNNPAPSIATNPSITAFSDTFLFTHDSLTEDDAVGVLVWVEPVVGGINDFTPTEDNISLDDVGRSHSISVNQDDSDASPPTFMFKYAVYDTFNKDPAQLNVSARVDVEMQARTGLAEAPSTPTGVSIDSNVLQGPQNVEALVTVSWGSVSGASVYDIEFSSGDTNASFTTSNTETSVTLKAATAYDVKVKARNSDNVSSPWSAVTSFNTAQNTAPSGDVTSLALTAGVNAVALTWVNPNDSDYDKTRIYRKANDSSSPTEDDFIVAITGESYYDGGLSSSSNYYYYAKAQNISGNLSDTFTQSSPTYVKPLEATTDVGPGDIGATEIADDAITTPKLSAGAVVAGKIASGEVISSHIAAGTINTNHVAAGAITADLIQADSLSVGAPGQEINDRLYQINVDNPGQGYETPPTVTITGSGTGATAEAFIRNGQVIGFSVLTPGSGYTTINVSLSAPTGATQVQATASAITRDTGLVKVENGAIVSDHVATGAIDANHIQSNSIVVGQNNSNGTGAVTIQNGYVNANMVTTGELITNEAQIAQAVIEEVITNNAIINTADIGTALVDSALIDNVIQSSNWDSSTKNGWRLSGTQSGAGAFETNNIAIYDSAGNIVLASGEDAVRKAVDADMVGGVSSGTLTTGISTAQNTANSAQSSANQAQIDANQALADAADARAEVDVKYAEAITASQNDAQARVNLSETQTKAYADGIVDAEEARAIADAQAKADVAEANAISASGDYADAKSEAARLNAIALASLDATDKADAALVAAEAYADAQANLAKTQAEAYADGIVDAEEARAIADAQAKADAAEANAKLEATIIGSATGTTTGNLVANGDMLAIDVSGKIAGVEPSYGTTSNSVITRKADSSAVGGQVLSLRSTDSSIGCVFPAMKVDPNASYRVEIRAKSNGSYSSGFYSGIGYYTGDLPVGKTHIGLNTTITSVTQAPSSSLTWPISDQSISTSWQTFSYEFTPPAGVKWMSLGILNWIGIGTNYVYVDQVRVTEINPVSVNANNKIGANGVGASTYIEDAAIQAKHLSISAVESDGGKTITTFDPTSDSPLTIRDAATDETLFDITVIDGKSQALVNGTAGINFINNVQSLTEDVKYALSPYYNGLGSQSTITNRPVDTAGSGGTVESFTMSGNGPEVSLKWKIYGSEKVYFYDPAYATTPQWWVQIHRNGTRILSKVYSGTGYAHDEYEEEDDTIPAESFNAISIDDGMIDSGAPANATYQITIRHQSGVLQNGELQLFEAVTGEFKIPATQKSTNGFVVDQLSGMIIQWGTVSIGANTTKSQAFPMVFPTACAQVVTNHKQNTTSNRDGWGAYTWNASTGYYVNGGGSTTSISYIAIGY